MKNNLFRVILSVFIFATLATAQSGGGITIEKSVIASGGGTISDGNITILNTMGQPVAGEVQGGSFTVFGGFITPPLSPTAAGVSVSGKVTTPNGIGLMNALVTMSNTSGNISTVRSNTFGNFKFEDVTVGETYIFQIVSREYQFAPQVIYVTEELADLDFTGF